MHSARWLHESASRLSHVLGDAVVYEYELREVVVCFFFFQAEDGIRDLTVTGVQTCALPILLHPERRWFYMIQGRRYARRPGPAPVLFDRQVFADASEQTCRLLVVRVLVLDRKSVV